MRKITLTGVALIALGLTACEPSQGTPSAKPAPAPTVVATAPDATQTRNNMREWHLSGGDRVMVPLVADLELAQENWRGDEFKRKGLADAVHKDVKAAMAYRPVPDEEGQKDWVGFLNIMKMVDDHLSKGNWDNADQGLKDADKAYKKFYDRNQAIFTGKR